jgi:hypothetical protein
MLQRADRRRATSSSGPRRNQIATPTWADRIFGKHNGDGTFATQLREAVIAWITVPQGAASETHQPERAGELTIASAAATLSSRLSAEDTPLTGPEVALMQQWLTTLADAASAAPPRPQRHGKGGAQ